MNQFLTTLQEVPTGNRTKELFLTLFGGPDPVVSIYTGDSFEPNLEELVRESFAITGIEITSDNRFLQIGDNYLTVEVSDTDHRLQGEEITDPAPDIVYQVGKFPIQEAPLISDGHYVSDSSLTPEQELEQLRQELKLDPQVNNIGYVTRFGTNKALLTNDTSRMTRRLKVARAIRSSINQVLSHPLLKNTQAFIFETTPTRAEAFTFAIGRPLYKSSLRYNKENLPLNALLTDDYCVLDPVTVLDSQDNYRSRLMEAREQLNSFLRSKNFNNHGSISPEVQQEILSKFGEVNPDSYEFIKDYLDHHTRDRVGLYYFIDR